MLNKSLDQIEEADFQSLIRDQVPEPIRLEFKRELNIASRDEKAEAAKDVSDLAKTFHFRRILAVALGFSVRKPGFDSPWG
jgi:hypothetical protein